MTFTINGEKHTVRAPAEGEAIADRLGAKTLRDQYGEVWVKLAGEWYAIA